LTALEISNLGILIEIGPALEADGFERLWVGQHYHPGDLTSGSPEIVCALLAGVTDRIRIGVAGVLLAYQPPYKIAWDYSLLAKLFPGRIDLGLARGGVPVDVEAQQALLGSDADSERRAAEVLRFMTERIAIEDRPEVWLLGSSSASSAIAARLGVSYCFGEHLPFPRAATLGPPAIETYRREFKPGFIERPRWGVSIGGICAETRARALELGRDVRHLTLSAIGTAHECWEAIDRVAARYQTEFVVFADGCGALPDKQASYSALAKHRRLTG
jgi:luciferase family oxidoreductase group 1